MIHSNGNLLFQPSEANSPFQKLDLYKFEKV